MKNLNQHVKSDKVKWIITGIALVLILAVLGGVVAMLFVKKDDGEEKPTVIEAEQTFCLNLTSVDELVGYEFDSPSDWTTYMFHDDTYNGLSCVAVDRYSPEFDKDGMLEILAETESVTVNLNGEELELAYENVDGGQYLFSSEGTAFIYIGLVESLISIGEDDFDGVFVAVSTVVPIESFRIVSFNTANEDQSEEPVPEYYTVTFDSNGGTSVDSQIIVPGGKVVKPENPVKSGVGFVEWQLDGEAYDFDTPVTSDITLVAYYL